MAKEAKEAKETLHVTKTGPLTIMDGVERARDSLARGVVPSAHTTLVPPRLGVQHVVTPRLL